MKKLNLPEIDSESIGMDECESIIGGTLGLPAILRFLIQDIINGTITKLL
jgi:hypothetical protein